MDKVLYDMMDWAGIEEIVYSEAAEPGRLLGPHMTEAGFLVQAFIPNAQAVTVKICLLYTSFSEPFPEAVWLT